MFSFCPQIEISEDGVLTEAPPPKKRRTKQTQMPQWRNFYFELLRRNYSFTNCTCFHGIRCHVATLPSTFTSNCWDVFTTEQLVLSWYLLSKKLHFQAHSSVHIVMSTKGSLLQTWFLSFCVLKSQTLGEWKWWLWSSRYVRINWGFISTKEMCVWEWPHKVSAYQVVCWHKLAMVRQTDNDREVCGIMYTQKYVIHAVVK